MSLIQLVTEYIRRYNMVATGETVVVGVSGGPDSMALLHILYRLRETLGINLVVAHLNHRFRGAEADADAQFVLDAARRLQLTAFVEARDVPAYSRGRGISPQVAAREVRYSFLGEVAVKTGASRVALGHHADDQAETILLHILRGTGAGGLKGMLPVRDDFYIRPLLAVRRREIEHYCRRHDLAARLDSSNVKPKYMRNRVRLELLPTLEKKYNPNLVESLNRLSEICRDEDDYLEHQAEQVFLDARLASPGNAVCLDAGRLSVVPRALLRRVMRRAWTEVCGDQADLNYRHIEQVIAIINGGGGYRQITLPRGITFKKYYEVLEFTLDREFKEIPFYQYFLKVPGITFVPEVGLSIGAEVLPVGRAMQPSGLDSWQVILDYDRLATPLIVRRRLSGDRFSPLGLDGTVKLKKFFIDRKIPRHSRDCIPLVLSGDDIVWVAGMRPGEKWKVTENTVKCLRLYIVDYE
ncbi:tRNA lysidine(34) synthetase TilS [Desulfoscipio sp. XC116]|uniref:tRNA lysidine(34) synthetase TilS n=1 Tax=Desulfoscipio sp. XC116 TaxID=3144975 RepID=UPI00325BDAD2